MRKSNRFVKLFDKEFALLLASGTKTQTVRQEGKRTPVIGDTIDCRTWSGKPHHSNHMDICTGTIYSVVRVVIESNAISVDNETYLSQVFMEDFARRDGFKDWNNLLHWFQDQYGLPFTGILIRWKDVK